MQIVCSGCGSIFDGQKGRRLCDVCLKAAKANSVVKTRICRTCGVQFSGGPRAWYCPACRAERSKKQSLDSKRHPSKRPIGSTDICAICGDEYIVKGWRQKYCANCAKTAVAETVLAQKSMIPKEVVQKYHAARNNRLKPCAACGRPFHTSIPTGYCCDLCKEYGKYRSSAQTDYKRGRRKTPPMSYNDWALRHSD